MMVESEGWKLIQNLDDNRFELYDVGRDPQERDDQWDQETGGAKAARDALHTALERFAQRQDEDAPTIDLTQEEIERLEALGYVQ